MTAPEEEAGSVKSLLASLAALPEEKRRRLIETASADELAEVYYKWGDWARPSQLPPPGDWRIWLLLAGRGFGKTRAGAEYVRSRIKAGARRSAPGATSRRIRRWRSPAPRLTRPENPSPPPSSARSCANTRARVWAARNCRRRSSKTCRARCGAAAS